MQSPGGIGIGIDLTQKIQMDPKNNGVREGCRQGAQMRTQRMVVSAAILARGVDAVFVVVFLEKWTI